MYEYTTLFCRYTMIVKFGHNIFFTLRSQVLNIMHYLDGKRYGHFFWRLFDWRHHLRKYLSRQK